MVAPEISVPLQMDESGTIRVSGTRVTLNVIIAAYQRGDTPEEIHEGFPHIRLADIYAVITYYLNNSAEVDGYLRQQRADAEQSRREIEGRQPEAAELRARLLTQVASSNADN